MVGNEEEGCRVAWTFPKTILKGSGRTGSWPWERNRAFG
jgi:hypothetical protein